MTSRLIVADAAPVVVNVVLLVIIGAVLLGVGHPRSRRVVVRHPGRMVKLVGIAAVLVIVMALVTNGAGTPVAGPATATCSAGYAPDDVTQPADNCGVQSLTLRYSKVLPSHQLSTSLEIDLYIEGKQTCGVAQSVLCGVDDNRPFVPIGSPDPHAAVTRNRVHILLDYPDQSLTITVSPSCRIHPFQVGVNSHKECFAPKQIGEGTKFDGPVVIGNSVTLDLTVLQTNFPTLLNVGEVHNSLIITTQNDGTFALTGHGSKFPDLAVLYRGFVVYAARGNDINNVFDPGTLDRTYGFQSGK